MSEGEPTRPRAFLIFGEIGAGKTTFAKQLEASWPAIRFTHDEWMRRLYGEDSPLEHFPTYHARVTALMETVWTHCLELGLSVVLDFGFWTRCERDVVRARASQLGFEHVLYALECPEELRWKRFEARNLAQTSDSLHIARETFSSLHDRVEPLEADEEHVLVSTA